MRPHFSYTAVAIVLHWAIAAAVVANLLLGWWMADAIDVPETQLRAITGYQLHKSLGLTVLLLSVIRLAWRLLHPPPAPPPAMPRWQRIAAAATHWAFYVLMLALPLSGWLYVSAQWRDGSALNVPTLWFGLFGVPHLFGIDQQPESFRAMFSANAVEAHRNLAWIACALLALHVVAALKHHFLDRDDVLARMVPGLPARGAPLPPAGRWDRRVVTAGVLAVALGLAAIAATILRIPERSLAFSFPPGGTDASSRAVAGRWSFDPVHGEIVFSGVHAGANFRGRFTRWSARIEFDPDDLGASTVEAAIDTASAVDGVALHDEALPQEEWFNVADYPQALFRSTRLSRAGGGYRIDGELLIKDRRLPVSLALAFEDSRPRISGRFEIDRVAANLGMESDPQAEWVSRLIAVTVNALGQPN